MISQYAVSVITSLIQDIQKYNSSIIYINVSYNLYNAILGSCYNLFLQRDDFIYNFYGKELKIDTSQQTYQLITE